MHKFTGDSEIKWDGHTHGPYCRHGSSASMESYIVRAVDLGFQRISLTEHPPLPDQWLKDVSVQRILGMDKEDLPHYLEDALVVKKKFQETIDVRIGYELDYLEDNEDFIWMLLERGKHAIEEVIISVHYLPGKNGMRCVDLSAQDIQEGLLTYYGCMERLVEVYFEHQERAITLAQKFDVPVRLGHVTLIDKFLKNLPAYDLEMKKPYLDDVYNMLAKSRIQLDANMAGIDIPSCGVSYPAMAEIIRAKEIGVSCIFGSDAHAPESIGRHYNVYTTGFLE